MNEGHGMEDFDLRCVCEPRVEFVTARGIFVLPVYLS